MPEAPHQSPQVVDNSRKRECRLMPEQLKTPLLAVDCYGFVFFLGLYRWYRLVGVTAYVLGILGAPLLFIAEPEIDEYFISTTSRPGS